MESELIRKAQSLEDAFLEFTGKVIREEESNSADRMRQASKMWRGGGRR